MKLHYKWLLIVGLNSILGFVWGYAAHEQNITHLLAMLLGVLTWFLIYLSFDYYLINNDLVSISKKLTLSALIRVFLQLFMFPEIIAGSLALITCGYFGLTDPSKNLAETYFFLSYAMTMLTGLYLSVFCSIIYVAVTLIEKFIPWYKNTSKG